MFENIAAIDVGTYSVKLVTVRTGFRDFQLKSFAYEDIDQNIEDPFVAIKEAILRILDEEDLKNYKIVTNLPMEKEIIRNITFPFNDVEKIAEAIPFEAEENIPFKLDDLILDFQALKHGKQNEGRVLLAAAHKDTLYDFLGVLSDCGIQPIKMGMEANALFECYRYFNIIEEETVIQIDIGHNKTIINFISDKRLLYTRSISIGLNLIHKAIMDILKLNAAEAARIFESLNLDFTSYENNIQRNYFKSLKISKSKFKKIYTVAEEIFNNLMEQISLTLRAVRLDFGGLSFSRILISGGGSNITGIGSILSGDLELPVVALPFLEDYKEQKIQTHFPIAFGTILSYIYQRRSSINFLKGEFIPDIARESRKIYYLSGGFLILTMVILLVNVILSAILTTKSNSRYNKIIAQRYQKYFHTAQVSDDPVTDAMRLLKKKKKEITAITQLIPENSSVLDLLKEIISYYPGDSSFNLRNMVINERVIRIDGSIGESKSIDTFKEKLIQSKKFDSVTLNIKYSRKNEVRFSMTIKLKLPNRDNKAGKR